MFIFAMGLEFPIIIDTSHANIIETTQPLTFHHNQDKASHQIQQAMFATKPPTKPIFTANPEIREIK